MQCFLYGKNQNQVPYFSKSCVIILGEEWMPYNFIPSSTLHFPEADNLGKGEAIITLRQFFSAVKLR
jgi:hypothetical protein